MKISNEDGWSRKSVFHEGFCNSSLCEWNLIDTCMQLLELLQGLDSQKVLDIVAKIFGTSLILCVQNPSQWIFSECSFFFIPGLPKLLFFATKAIFQFLQLFAVLLPCGSRCTHFLLQVIRVTWKNVSCRHCVSPVQNIEKWQMKHGSKLLHECKNYDIVICGVLLHVLFCCKIFIHVESCQNS